MPSHRRPLLVCLVAVFVTVTLVLSSTVARADPAVSLDPLTIKRDPSPPIGNPADSINFADCENNAQLTFPLSLTGLPASGDHLQAWVGDASVDCSLSASRAGGTQTCWPIADGDLDTSTNNPTFQVSVRQIVAQLAVSPKTAFKDASKDDAACLGASLPTGLTTLDVWFLFADGGGAPVGTPVKVAYLVDLRGPSPPTAVSAHIGDGALIIDFTASSDDGAEGYTVYCDPPPNGASPPATDASPHPAAVCAEAGAGDAASDASTSFDATCAAASTSNDGGASTCASGVFGGALTPTTIDPAYVCGQITSGKATSGLAMNLTNGVHYTVVLAAKDAYQNIGAWSAPACETPPQEIEDFWGAYRDRGGLAGGGFCSASRAPARATMAPLALLVGAAALAIARRRRRSGFVAEPR